MSWKTLPAPGKVINGIELGPCKDSGCGHTRCEMLRSLANTRCYGCGAPIGYEAPFVGEGETAAHYKCEKART